MARQIKVVLAAQVQRHLSAVQLTLAAAADLLTQPKEPEVQVAVVLVLNTVHRLV
jgi:hypothetical protein